MISKTVMSEDRRVRVIGIGSGDPTQLTGEAAAALGSVAYVVAADKGPADPLLDVRRRLCDAFGVDLVAVPDPQRDRDAGSTASEAGYAVAVRDWHQARTSAYEDVLLGRPGDAAFLVWGDPAFYDSTLRIVESLVERGRIEFTYDVLPGISSPQLLAARHRIVLHRVGEPVLVTTGRRLAATVAAGHRNIVVMLDGHLTCLDLELADWQIWWGANLGSAGEELVSGTLDEIAADLRARREAVRTEAGWVMDTYLLRGPQAGADHAPSTFKA